MQAEREAADLIAHVRRKARDEAGAREARRWRGGTHTPQKRTPAAEDARRAKDAARNASRDAKLRAASDARVRDKQPATVREAVRVAVAAHALALHWETAVEAAGGPLAFESLDVVHDWLAKSPHAALAYDA